MTIDLDFDKNHLWHPYTSTTNPLPCQPVASASGVTLTFEDSSQAIDGMASWWSAIHGYNVAVLKDALINQTSKMAHVVFGGLTHEPDIEMSKKLIQITPEPQQKIFVADSGSIAAEVALKLALQYQNGQGMAEKSRMDTVNNGYHGP